jgi:16S rRNA (adenine1518-N6/adenine1519-N6)-dimethyltransferase
VNTEHPRELLAQLEQRARRRFAQHFLHDTSVVDRTLRGARVEPGERVLEIGPGLGALTSRLIDRGAKVTAVELDRDLAAFVAERFPSVRLVEADATRVDWSEVCPGEAWKVVANLPYNVGTQVTMDLLRAGWPRFASVTVMLQLEVVQRLMAPPGNRTYGALSVEAQVRAQPVFLLKVPPAAFFPPPKVQSAVVRLDLREEVDTGGVDPAFFDRVVRAGFAQRRKTLANALGARFGKSVARAAISEVGLPERVRAEQVDVPGFRALARALSDATG